MVDEAESIIRGYLPYLCNFRIQVGSGWFGWLGAIKDRKSDLVEQTQKNTPELGTIVFPLGSPGEGQMQTALRVTGGFK